MIRSLEPVCRYLSKRMDFSKIRMGGEENDDCSFGHEYNTGSFGALSLYICTWYRRPRSNFIASSFTILIGNQVYNVNVLASIQLLNDSG